MRGISSMEEDEEGDINMDNAVNAMTLGGLELGGLSLMINEEEEGWTTKTSRRSRREMDKCMGVLWPISDHREEAQEE